jgi:DNA-binding NarL/FixJ family response regulator
MTGAGHPKAAEDNNMVETERRPLRVFIADDSRPVADMLTELVSCPGRIDVIGVGETEAAAIDAIRSLRPDVVILDLQLKAGSGTNVIRAVRASAELSGVRLMVTSNHASPQLRAGCMELGADDYFDKVKELGALSARLAELAEARRPDGP